MRIVALPAIDGSRTGHMKPNIPFLLIRYWPGGVVAGLARELKLKAGWNEGPVMDVVAVQADIIGILYVRIIYVGKAVLSEDWPCPYQDQHESSHDPFHIDSLSRCFPI